MYSAYNEMPGHSRIWIYPASRTLTPEEVKAAEKHLTDFCNSWKAHGMPLKTSFTIAYNRFIILAADEKTASASGCSIDSSVHVMQSVSKLLQVDLFDRTQVPFLKNGEIVSYALRDLKGLFSKGELGSDDRTFHLLAATKEEWESKGVLSVAGSWLSRYVSEAV
ncbi:MAG: hypothetical protein ACO3FI_00635 [Cyclobacteriaceae bacterium]